MPKPLSIDLRERILKDVLGGMNDADAGRKYSMSAEFVRRFHRRYEATQEIAPLPPIPRVVPFYRKHEATIRAAVAKHSGPNSDSKSASERFGALCKNSGSRLKKHFTPLAKTIGCRRPTSRVRFLSAHRHRPSPTRIPRRNTRSDGLFTPVVIDGTLNDEILRAPVEQHLAPQLRSGDIVLMDNLPSHKVAGVLEAIRAVGAELVYQPPYCPTKPRSRWCSRRSKGRFAKGRRGPSPNAINDGENHSIGLPKRNVLTTSLRPVTSSSRVAENVLG